MKKILITLAITGLSSLAMAQSTGELFKFSNYDFSASTARSAGMAGAFTSLGADMSSMSINPAGLAMYTSSEATISLGLTSHNTSSNYGGKYSMSMNNTAFSIPNAGAVLNFGDINLGVAVNRLANLNSNMSAIGDFEQFNTKGRIWVDQLEGIPSTELDNENTIFDRRNPLIWDAIMGYDSYMIDPGNTTTGSTWYTLNGIIDPNDYIASSYSRITEGAVDEMLLSASYNWDDIIYIGASMGFQWMSYTERSVYTEENLIDSQTIGVFNNMYLRDFLSMNGFGFNIKLGVTVRPTPWLRVGLAYHTPTWMTIEERSNADMEPFFEGGDGRYSWTPDLFQDYYAQSPSRLLAGASATLFGALIVSADYEVVWYNAMKYTTDINTSGWRDPSISSDIDNLPNFSSYVSNSGDIDLNGMIDSYYKPVNNFRFGVEGRPLRSLFVRAGFGYASSPYADVQSYYDPEMKMSDFGDIMRFSGGLGYRSRNFNVDIAYVYSSYSELPNKFFDYVTSYAYDTFYNTPAGNPDIIPAGTSVSSFENINQSHKDHNIILTLGWRF